MKSWRKFMIGDLRLLSANWSLISEVSDHGCVTGLAAFQRVKMAHWRRIGRLIFNQAVASYNGDFVIQFHHPTWRHQRNDASTAVRVKNRKVG